jgi:hypothetical protein
VANIQSRLPGKERVVDQRAHGLGPQDDLVARLDV